MSRDGKQLHFTELVWESTEQNLPIPPRDPAEAGVPKLPTAKPKKKAPKEAAVQLQLWDMEETQEPATTTESQFVARARELADHKEPAALFVPFKSYWPTYGHMTGAQGRWYFFWRDEVRQGRYPKTDLSYIFLHVYELINGVGWDEPREGYRQLNLLWEAYRDQYKRLDQYLGGWIADFSFVHHLEIPLSDIAARSRGLAGDLAELELMRCLSAAPEQLSFEVLTVMSDYDISKSKFYTGEGQAAAERYIPQVVALIDAYVARKHGLNLIGMFQPGPAVVRERYLFRSAVYDISLYGYSVLVPVVRISKSPPLRSLITRLFRLTENKLRALVGYRGRLKDVKVDADMDELVTRFLQREFRKAEQKEKGPAVVIDDRKLQQLQSDSEVVRTLLTVEETEELEERRMAEEDSAGRTRIPAKAGHGDQAADPAVAEADSEPAAGGSKAAGAAHAVDSAPAHWQQFAAALTPLERAVVQALAEGKGSAAVQELAAAGGTMAELLFDGINETAMDLLGDLLIDEEQLNEEFVPMLQYLGGVNDR
ncbi:TerB N-terminal domain-containing protein [Paenibacillus sp. S150]|uniref:TerB N-terminal domain-containing protein n=1 Tax=Paenibacillus sp. S150 TaxID=2749826 RepID=UPI001C585026|nr:TerB N-terminal domain-containing protein [Paenibacillus sp. S150]MBW4080549.1 TerB N-terminal domain-containing protein [Paenibacillus sp. S150]